MDLRLTQHDVAGRLVLALDGAADLASLPRLHDALQRVLGDLGDAPSVAIDLDGVSVLDDTALGLLLGAAATARARHGTLVVVCSNERLRTRLADTRFDLAVDVVRALGEGVVDRRPDRA
jgi:anti-anti-sigma factor